MIISESLPQLKSQINGAARECNRDSRVVKLLAVSKGQPLSQVKAAAELGQRAFGESYLQEALIKIEALKAFNLEWHFIGRIQSNKTADIAQHFDWVHSIDRVEIARRLSHYALQYNRQLHVCLQVNLSEEPTKSGLLLEDVFPFAQQISQWPGLVFRGLMAIPAVSHDFHEQVSVYKALYEKQEELISMGFDLDTLSMGMSNDFKAAIAAGSTMVRVGTALFGARL